MKLKEIDKEQLRRIEKELYNYYESDKKVTGFKKTIEILENNIAALEKRIKTVDIEIPVESRSITFEERVQSSGDGTSYVERTMINKIDNLEREIENDKKEIYRLEDLIRKLNKNKNIIEIQISDISEEYIKYIDLRYNKKLKNWQIANELNISHVTCTRLKNKIVNSIANWGLWL